MRWVALGMVVLGSLGCGTQELVVTPGGEAGAGGAGGAGGAEPCAGQCVPKEPLGWSDPALLWYGPPDEAPDCPPEAPMLGYEGHAGLGPVPGVCGTCLCDPPAQVSCELPLDWAAHAASWCDIPGAPVTDFSAPAGWDGQCTTVNAIPAGQSCGGALCVQSLSVDAPTVLVTGTCTPKMEEPPAIGDVAWPWATFARACVGTAYPPCLDAGNTCAPAPPEGEGAPTTGRFITCVFHEGERDCPDVYPDRHVFYSGVEDTRGCTACGCGAPEGASCSIMASVYSDGQCGVQLASNVVSSAAPFCGTIAPGAALGSKAATVVDADPGTCPPTGGEPTGGVTPSEPATFCCRL